MKKIKLLIVTMAAVLVLAACGSSNDKKITVGAKNFTEQFLLATMTTLILEENGFKVDEKSNMGSSALRQALENKQVDLTWDYTGTGLVTYLGEEPISDKQEAFEKVKEIDKENDIHWMNLAEVNNTYTLAMRAEQADELGIHSISDLATYMNENDSPLKIATDAEFANRSDGLPGVEELYGFNYQDSNINEMTYGINYDALRDGEVESTAGHATDARIDAFDLVNLEDDKGFFPSYNAAVSLTNETFEKYPEIEEILQPLAEALDDEVMRELNYYVDIEDRNMKDVAEEYLTSQGLLKE